MSDLQFHPAANEFPLLDDKRLAELSENIRQNGQRETIKLFSGQIVDGRNRFRACLLGNIAPQFETLDPATDPWAYVWSLNGERRDLTADQRYLIWKSCHEKSEAWETEKLRIFSDANRKRAEAMTGVPFAPKGESRMLEKVRPQVVGGPSNRPKSTTNATANQKAEASKTNRGSVERMDALVNSRPDLAEKVKTGEIVLRHGYETALSAGHAAIFKPVARSVASPRCSARI